MKIRVDFTLDIPRGSLPALLDAAGGAETEGEVRDFVKYEAQQYVVDYLRDHGAIVKVVREN